MKIKTKRTQNYAELHNKIYAIRSILAIFYITDEEFGRPIPASGNVVCVSLPGASNGARKAEVAQFDNAIDVNSLCINRKPAISN